MRKAYVLLIALVAVVGIAVLWQLMQIATTGQANAETTQVAQATESTVIATFVAVQDVCTNLFDPVAREIDLKPAECLRISHQFWVGNLGEEIVFIDGAPLAPSEVVSVGVGLVQAGAPTTIVFGELKLGTPQNAEELACMLRRDNPGAMGAGLKRCAK